MTGKAVLLQDRCDLILKVRCRHNKRWKHSKKENWNHAKIQPFGHIEKVSTAVTN